MLKKVFKKLNNAYAQVALEMLILLSIALIPLLLIGQFAHPCADDYTYGYYTHAFWIGTHSLSQTLQWALTQVKSTYATWQGTFSSVFLMSLSPAIWGEGYYFLTPIIMLTMIILPHFYLLKKIIVDLLSGSKSIWIISSCVICFLLIETMFSPVAGIFWFNGAVHYVFMHGCMILLFGLILGMIITPPKKFSKYFLILLASFLALLCGGANYPTALLGTLGTLFLITLLLKNRKHIYYIFPLIVYGAAFYLNLSAPGNKLRQTNFQKSSPLIAILNSFSELFTYTRMWFTIQIILFMLLMIPFFWKLADKRKVYFRFPIVFTLVSVSSIACMLTPGLYALGSANPARTINIVKMWFILVLFLNELYWLGFIKLKLSEKLPAVKIDVRIWSIGIILLLCISFNINVNRRFFDYSSYTAYISLRTGEAQQYHQEYLDRVTQLSSDEKYIELAPFSAKPYLLYFSDITTDPYDWRNMAVSRWYCKEQVRLKE